VVEVAEQYPMTAVLGVDISPVQPFSAPENCKFFLGNLSEGLDFNDGTMDLVQSRILMAGVTKEQWPGYLEEVYRIVKPGTGWAQMIETSAFLVCDDDSVPEDAPIWEFQRHMRELYEEQKSLHFTPDHLEHHMRDAGFADIQIINTRIHIGPWATENPELKTAGDLAIKVWGDTLLLLADTMTDYYPNDNEREEFGKRVVKDLENPDYHLYSPMLAILGRKPEIDN